MRTNIPHWCYNKGYTTQAILAPPVNKIMSKLNRPIYFAPFCCALAIGIISFPLKLQAQAPSAHTMTVQKQESLALSLDAAVHLALEKSPALQASLLGIDAARYEEQKNRGSLLPKVNLTGSYAYMLKKQKVYFGDIGSSPMGYFLDDGIEMGQTHSLQGGVVAGMPLVAPQLWASLKLNKEAVALAEEKALGSKIDLIAEVKKAYMAVLLAQESQRVLEGNYANAEANYKNISDKYQHGLVAEYDKLRMETQMKNILPNVIAARTAVQLAEAKLKVVMGISLETPICVTERLPDYKDRVYQHLPQEATLSLRDNSTLRQLDRQGRQLDAALHAKRMAYLPTLSLNFNYQYSFAANKFHLDERKRWSPFSTIGLSLDVPIYNGGARGNDVRATEVQIRQLAAQRIATERQLQLGLMNSTREQKNALEQFVSAQDAVMTAERGRSIAQVRYKSGAGTLLELNDAETALLQAQLNYSQAIYNYMVAVYALEALQGEGLPNEAK